MEQDHDVPFHNKKLYMNKIQSSYNINCISSPEQKICQYAIRCNLPRLAKFNFLELLVSTEKMELRWCQRHADDRCWVNPFIIQRSDWAAQSFHCLEAFYICIVLINLPVSCAAHIILQNTVCRAKSIPFWVSLDQNWGMKPCCLQHSQQE